MSTTATTSFEGYTSTDLLDAIDGDIKELDLVFAEAAFAEFYRRHARRLYDLCFAAARSISDPNPPQWAYDLRQEILAEIWLGKVRLPQRRKSDHEDREVGVALWLAGVVDMRMRRLRELAAESRLRYQNYESEAAQAVRTVGDDYTLRAPVTREALERALASLTAKDRDILVTSFTFSQLDEDGKSRCRVPNWLNDLLMQQYGLVPASLRQARSRAIGRLRHLLNPGSS